MVELVLITDNPTNETPELSDSDKNKQEGFISRMDIINSKRREGDVTSEANLYYLHKSTRNTMQNAYNRGWRFWEDWRSKQDLPINSKEYNPVTVHDFL